MFIYNVTTHVEPSIEAQWLQWMKHEHLPQMLETQYFERAHLFRVITQDDQGGVSYAAQYVCHSREDYEHYVAENAQQLRQAAQDQFGEKILSFRTELEEIILLQ